MWWLTRSSKPHVSATTSSLSGYTSSERTQGRVQTTVATPQDQESISWVQISDRSWIKLDYGSIYFTIKFIISLHSLSNEVALSNNQDVIRSDMAAFSVWIKLIWRLYRLGLHGAAKRLSEMWPQDERANQVVEKFKGGNSAWRQFPVSVLLETTSPVLPVTSKHDDDDTREYRRWTRTWDLGRVQVTCVGYKHFCSSRILCGTNRLLIQL